MKSELLQKAKELEERVKEQTAVVNTLKATNVKLIADLGGGQPMPTGGGVVYYSRNGADVTKYMEEIRPALVAAAQRDLDQVKAELEAL